MTLRRHSTFFLLGMLGATVLACSATGSEDVSNDELDNLAVESSGYSIDYDKFNSTAPYNTGTPIRVGHPEDAFSAIIQLGDKTIIANTHMFTKQVNIIPYANPSQEQQVAGDEGGRGDAVIAKYIHPGELGFMIKNHRPVYRTVSFDKPPSDDEEQKDTFKLQDTHIGIIVGVERNGVPGAISINNPRTYEDGAFGEQSYPMVFVKPTFPSQVSPDQQALYLENIRTMAVLFDTVSSFPENYDGGDPLAARNPAEVRRHVAMMVKAIGGDQAAQEFFVDPANLIYCAELAHVASSAGILVPLNKESVMSMQTAGNVQVTEEDWNKFVAAIDKGWPFATLSDDHLEEYPSADKDDPNPRLADLKGYKPNFARLAALRPIDQVVAPAKREDGLPSAGLAFEPMTMADIVQQFLRTHVPRDPGRQEGTPLEGVGEGIAPIQAKALASMEFGLYDSMKIDKNSPQRVRSITDENELMNLPAAAAAGKQFTVKDLLDGIVRVIGKSYGSYEEFQKNVQPWLIVARKVTGPRGDTGEGLFVPPSLLHVIAQGGHPGGYLGLQYLGHGLHFTLTRKVSDAPAAAQPPTGPAAEPFVRGEP